MAMQRWEYIHFQQRLMFEAEKYLLEYGMAGWELVSVVILDEFENCRYFLKRQIID